MKWQVEDIGVHCNILEDKPGVPKDDQAPIGMGFPRALANGIVDKHNMVVNALTPKQEDPDEGNS